MADPTASPTPRPRGASQLKMRTWHTYLSAIAAPTLLYFSLSGILQIFSLHESHNGYVAPPALTAIGRLHKDQILAPVPPHPETPDAIPPGPASTTHGGGAGEPRRHSSMRRLLSVYLLKWFFALCALSLAVTTVIGICIGAMHARRERVRSFYILIGLGFVIPLALILLGWGA